MRLAVQAELDWLAKRVAINRERAGIHYPSDTKGGELAAGNIFAVMLAIETGVADPWLRTDPLEPPLPGPARMI